MKPRTSQLAQTGAAAGQGLVWNGTLWLPGSVVTTVKDEGTSLTQRPTIDFQGAGVTATDDSVNGKTVVTIPGATGGMALIERKALAAAANTMSFTSPIPTTFKHLRIVGTCTKASSDSATATRSIILQANSTPLTFDYLEYDFGSSGSVTNASATGSTQPIVGVVGATRGAFQIDIIDYRATAAPPALLTSSFAFSSSFPAYSVRHSGAQATAQTAITQLTLVCSTSGVNFATLDATLYGFN